MKKKVYYRKLRSLDTESFREDTLTSPLLRDQAVELNALVDQYDNVLRSFLDLYAPLKQRTVTLPKSSTRNLGVIIDQCLDLSDHVKKICVSCHYHLRNIAKIRRYLSKETSEILVHAFISSKLDNCSSRS